MIFHSHYTHWYRFVYIFIMEFLLTIDFCLFCQAYRSYSLYSLIALFRFNVYSIMDPCSIWSYHLTVYGSSESGSLHIWKYFVQAAVVSLNYAIVMAGATSCLCPTPWLPFRGFTVTVLRSKRRLSKKLEKICQSFSGEKGGSHLVSIRNLEESFFLSSSAINIFGSVAFWTGLNDIQEEGDYVWTEGNKLQRGWRLYCLFTIRKMEWSPTDAIPHFAICVQTCRIAMRAQCLQVELKSIDDAIYTEI